MDIEQFYKFKSINIDLLPELRSYANDMSHHRNNKGGNVRYNKHNDTKYEKKPEKKPLPSIFTNQNSDKKKFYIEINGILIKYLKIHWMKQLLVFKM